MIVFTDVLSFAMLLGRKPGLTAAAKSAPSGENAPAEKRWLAELHGPLISLPLTAFQRRSVPAPEAMETIRVPSGENNALSMVELRAGVCFSRSVPRRAMAPSGSGS